MIGAWMLVLLALAGAALAVDCERATTAADLEGALERAELQYSALEIDAFRAAVDAARNLIPCLGEPVPRNIVARTHRAEGLWGFVERDPHHATRAFAAARSIEPSYRFPTTLVPASNPVLAEYEALDVSGVDLERVPLPASGYTRIDGRSSQDRSLGWPSLLQVFAEDGSVAASAYLWPEDPLPGYAVAEVPPPAPPVPPVAPDPGEQVEPTPVAPPGEPIAVGDPPLDDRPRKRRRLRRNLFVAAGSAGAVSLGSWLVTQAVYRSFQRDETATLDDLNFYKGVNNAFNVTAGVTLAVAAGTGVSALFVARW